MRTSERNAASGRSSDLHNRSVLIAVEPPAFQRLIEHVLHGQSGFRVVGRSTASLSPAHAAARLTPDVIIVNHRLQRRERGDVLIDLRRVSPSSTLILLTHSLGESAPPEAVDAWLPEDAVVRQLLPVIRKAAPRTTSHTLRPASAGPRT
jgi:DNA-binding NarL/FixJ family response regulator